MENTIIVLYPSEITKILVSSLKYFLFCVMRALFCRLRIGVFIFTSLVFASSHILPFKKLLMLLTHI